MTGGIERRRGRRQVASAESQSASAQVDCGIVLACILVSLLFISYTKLTPSTAPDGLATKFSIASLPIY